MDQWFPKAGLWIMYAMCDLRSRTCDRVWIAASGGTKAKRKSDRENQNKIEGHADHLKDIKKIEILFPSRSGKRISQHECKFDHAWGARKQMTMAVPDNGRLVPTSHQV